MLNNYRQVKEGRKGRRRRGKEGEGRGTERTEQRKDEDTLLAILQIKYSNCS